MPDAELLAELKRIDADLPRTNWWTDAADGMIWGSDGDSLAQCNNWHGADDVIAYEVIAERIAALRNLLPRIIAALTPGGAVVGVHTASESDHDRPPGSERP